jgi:flagellar basal-body rod modification protein FlgD
MTNAVTSTSTTGTNASSSTMSANPNDRLMNKDMFLQLMVAQLRNQNPLNPVDGVDFLAQLSQISSVEQQVQMRQELEAIHATIKELTKGGAGTTSETSGGKQAAA